MADLPIKRLNDLLADDGTVVLCDSAPFRQRYDAWHKEFVRTATRFEQIPEDVLIQTRLIHEAMYMLYCTDGVFTTEGVIEEMSHFYAVMTRTFDWMDRRSHTNPVQREQLQDVITAYEAVIEAATPMPMEQPEFYRRLCERVRDVAQIYGSKKCYRGSKDKPDVTTDEDLVAAAVYRSCVDKGSTIIPTCDSDIGRIVQHITVSLAEEGSMDAIRTLHEHPIKVYFAPPREVEEIGFELVADTGALYTVNCTQYAGGRKRQDRPRA